MTCALHKAPSAVGVLVLISLVAGCSGGSRETGAVGSSGAEPAAIAITTSPFFVTVENHAGAALLDLQIAIATVNVLNFTTMISRLENGDKRDVQLGAFHSRDGTPFSLRIARPKSVVVSAADLVGKKYQVTQAWQ